jgi:hypothetical protein
MADYLLPMHKIKTCRFTTANDGSLEVTITIPARAVAKADEFAARLPSTREEVLRSYLENCFETLHEGIEDHCLVAWRFSTAQEGESFIKREKLDLRGMSLVEWEDGSGFSVDTLYQLDKRMALILEEREAKSVAA